MTELIVGLLGGGTLVQLINLLVNARTSRRQKQAEALDAEISALEHTLKIVSESVEIESRRHSLERQELKEEINTLRCRLNRLNELVATLQVENARLRVAIDAGVDYTIPTDFADAVPAKDSQKHISA